jgi:hypothetical protein
MRRSIKFSEQGFVFYGDIWGFKAQLTEGIANQTVDSLTKMWQESLSMVKDKGFNAVAFSDSIFIFFPSSKISASAPIGEIVVNIVEILSKLVSISVSYQYLLRGCLAHGSFIRTKSVFGGEALLKAHTMEQKIKPPLVCIPDQLLIELEKNDYCSKLRQSCVGIDGLDENSNNALVIYPEEYDDYKNLIKRRRQEASKAGLDRVESALILAENILSASFRLRTQDLD